MLGMAFLRALSLDLAKHNSSNGRPALLCPAGALQQIAGKLSKPERQKVARPVYESIYSQLGVERSQLSKISQACYNACQAGLRQAIIEVAESA